MISCSVASASPSSVMPPAGVHGHVLSETRVLPGLLGEVPGWPNS
jgi:hypothetical protein